MFVHVVSPIGDKTVARMERESETFKIFEWADSKVVRIYKIECTEEEMTYLTLIYGREKVWAR